MWKPKTSSVCAATQLLGSTDFSFIYFVTLKIALLELHFTAYIRHSHLAVFSSL